MAALKAELTDLQSGISEKLSVFHLAHVTVEQPFCRTCLQQIPRQDLFQNDCIQRRGYDAALYVSQTCNPGNKYIRIR